VLSTTDTQNYIIDLATIPLRNLIPTTVNQINSVQIMRNISVVGYDVTVLITIVNSNYWDMNSYVQVLIPQD